MIDYDSLQIVYWVILCHSIYSLSFYCFIQATDPLSNSQMDQNQKLYYFYLYQSLVRLRYLLSNSFKIKPDLGFPLTLQMMLLSFGSWSFFSFACFAQDLRNLRSASVWSFEMLTDCYLSFLLSALRFPNSLFFWISVSKTTFNGLELPSFFIPIRPI